MSVSSYGLQACGRGFVPPNGLSGRWGGSHRGVEASRRCVQNGYFVSQLLPLVQVRVDCHSNRALSQTVGRVSSYGATFGERCHKAQSSLRNAAYSSGLLSVDDSEEDVSDDEGDAWLVHEVTTPFNQITVLEVDEAADHELAGAYVLKLDNADLAHSVFWSNGKVWTIGCHDVFASLPPLLPEGRIGILGLGAGTVARLLLHIWPSLHLEGWELDPEVIRVARDYFGLADLESPEDSPVQAKETSPGSSKKMKKKGRLVVHTGDALGPQANVKGGFAGIMVDIFINGAVCEELAEVRTWEKLKSRLRPRGRIMANCIPNRSHLEEGDGDVSKEWDEMMHKILRAMEIVFPGEVSVRELTDGNNVMLLSGEVPDGQMWASKVPDRLKEGVHEWKDRKSVV